MKTVVFAGPTIPADLVEETIGEGALVLPPAAQGDVYRSLRLRPDCLVLLDGYFHDVPTVWHKEILWALAQGVPVVGAASMGALRAAELHPFGMTGVGRVFELYRDHVLVDDDEVALAHAEAENGYRPLSEPLVNLRATLDRAVEDRVIVPATRDRAVRALAAMPFPERSYGRLLYDLRGSAEADALRGWLGNNRVDQKRADALAALRMVAAGRVPGPQCTWLFERTAMWEEFVRVEGRRRPGDESGQEHDLLRGFESDPVAFGEVTDGALARLLAGQEGIRHGRAVSADDLLDTLEVVRRRLGLEAPEDLQTWMHANDLTTDGLAALLRAENDLAWACKAFEPDLGPLVVDRLRMTGRYVRVT